jgi:hypothetical protein
MTRVFTLCVLLAIFVQGCSTSTPEPTVTSLPSPSPLPTNTVPPTVEPSPTFTPPPVPNLPTETVTPLPISTNDPNAVVATEAPSETPKSSGVSRCYGMVGRIEVRAVVAEAAGLGLDPFSIGEIPFEITSQYAPYRVAGKSKLVYKNKTEEDWGTYKGDINLMGSISGQCLTGDKDGELHINISINGSQLVVIRSKGYNKQIPWSGGVSIPLIFGHSEGYTMAGEKWLFILHMGPPKE